MDRQTRPRRPYTFVVMALLIAILGGVAIERCRWISFPISTFRSSALCGLYQRLSPEEMEKRVVTIFERALTSTVNDIEHIESQSYNGVSVLEGLLPAGSQDRNGHRAGDRHLANPAADVPPGIFPAEHH